MLKLFVGTSPTITQLIEAGRCLKTLEIRDWYETIHIAGPI